MSKTKTPKPFESGAFRARFVTILYGISAVLSVVGIISTLLEIELINAAANGAFLDDAAIDANDLRQGAVGIAQIVFAISGFIALLFWTHRAQRNLTHVARGTEYSPGWAVAYFLIPILNAFRPYYVYRQFWQASEPNVSPDSALAWKAVRPSRWIGWWWALWVLANIIGRAILRYGSRAETLDEILLSSWASLALDVIDIPLYLMTIWLVRKIDRMQILKYERITKLLSNLQNLPPPNTLQVKTP
jgi:hypothetical protein